MAQCPICRKVPKPRVENSAFPFCSTRCKSIDLGNWLNEQYRIPVEDGSDDETERAPADAASGPSRDMRN